MWYCSGENIFRVGKSGLPKIEGASLIFVYVKDELIIVHLGRGQTLGGGGGGGGNCPPKKLWYCL